MGTLPPNHVGKPLQGKQLSWVLGSDLLQYPAAEQAATGPHATSDGLAEKVKAFAFPMGHFLAVKDMLQHRNRAL